MATAYTEAVTATGANGYGLPADLKHAILQSSDWAHLYVATGNVSTTLSAAPAAGATTISVAASIPAGSVITIDPGVAGKQEVLTVSAVSGTGPYTLTLAGNNGNGLRYGTHASGATVQSGAYVKATTTRGAQMVLNLVDAAPNLYTLNMAVYRTHDGTTGVDRKTCYLNWNSSLYANASDPLHWIVSAGKEHLHIWVHGPYTGEQYGSSGTGAMGEPFFLGDIVPYFSGDTTPAVVLAAADNATYGSNTVNAYVSRDAANATSWVTADILTLTKPMLGTTNNNVSPQQAASLDSNTYLWPYVVIERVAGLRGRINKLFMVGWTAGQTGSLTPAFGTQYTWNSETYSAVPSVGSYNSAASGVVVPHAVGVGLGSTMPVLAVPRA